MRSKEIKKAIDGLGPWYQRFEMEGQFTSESKMAGEPVWSGIRRIMREDIKDLDILELWSNAAYYTIMLSKEGANVTAVEPDKKYYIQGRWTQYFFEQYDMKKYPVKFINESPIKINFKTLEWFDYILLSSGFDFMEKKVNKERYISHLCSKTDRIILPTKNDSIKNSIGYYNSIFLEHEFYMIRKIVRDIPILLYGTLVKEPFFIEQINK